MKRIALVLIIGLSASVGRADEFDIVDYGIFRSVDPLAQRDEWGTTHQTPHVNATILRPDIPGDGRTIQGPQRTRSGSRVCWLPANGVAPPGLLLRARGRRIYAGGFIRYRAAPKELFHARDRHAHYSRAAGVAHALSHADESSS